MSGIFRYSIGRDFSMGSSAVLWAVELDQYFSLPVNQIYDGTYAFEVEFNASGNLAWPSYSTHGAFMQTADLNSFIRTTTAGLNMSLAGIAQSANLVGGKFGDVLIGGTVNDNLYGGGGRDTLYGGDGNDTFHVKTAQNPTIIEYADEGVDTVAATRSYVLGDNLERLVLKGTADLVGTGNALANSILGTSGDNIIDGKDGRDTLVGKGGSDTFAFSTAPDADNVDRIADFDHGSDTIALDPTIFGLLGFNQDGTLEADQFAVLGDGIRRYFADDRIIYHTETGVLYYDADGYGGARAVAFAVLSGARTGIDATDFVSLDSILI